MKRGGWCWEVAWPPILWQGEMFWIPSSHWHTPCHCLISPTQMFIPIPSSWQQIPMLLLLGPQGVLSSGSTYTCRLCPLPVSNVVPSTNHSASYFQVTLCSYIWYSFYILLRIVLWALETIIYHSEPSDFHLSDVTVSVVQKDPFFLLIVVMNLSIYYTLLSS